MSIPKLRLRNGLTRTKGPLWASEPNFIAQMNSVLRELEADILDIMDQLDDVSAEVALEALKPTMEKAKYYCPKKTGELVNSAYIEITDYRSHRSTGTRLEMGFAKDGNPRYAVYVHENMDKKHAAPTSSKFLQRAVEEDQSNIAARIAAGYQEFMGVAGQDSLGE